MCSALISVIILVILYCNCCICMIVPPKPDLSNPTSTTIDVVPISTTENKYVFNVHVYLKNVFVVSNDIQPYQHIFTIRGLQPNTEYEANIVDCKAFADCSRRSPKSIFRTRPSGPSKPVVRAPTNTSLEVAARDTQFTTGHFELTASAVGRPPITIACPRTAESCVITGLSSNRVYQVTSRICPGPPAICSDPSPPTESGTTLGEIHDILVKKEHANMITISWKIPDTVQKSTVRLTQKGTCKDFSSSCLVETSPIAKHECTFTDLPSNAEFKFAVVGCAADVGGVAGICTPTAYATGFTLPAAPRQLYVSKITSSSAKVEWQAPVGNHRNIDIFRVQANTSGSQEIVYCESKGHKTCGSFCNLYGLKGGSEYTAYAEACIMDTKTNQTVCSPRSLKSHFRSEVTYMDIPLIFIMLSTFGMLLIPITQAFIYSYPAKQR